jgi:hypothetical protein
MNNATIGEKGIGFVGSVKTRTKIAKQNDLHFHIPVMLTKIRTRQSSKTLRDFALLEAITASFGDGGVVEDKLPTNGIFADNPTKENNKGIPLY